MRKSLLVACCLPLLTACEEITVPYVVPLAIPMDTVSDQGPDGLYRLNASSEATTLDDIRAEMPSAYRGVQEFTVTSLTLHDPGAFDQVRDPEYDEVRDPEYDEVRDPEYDEVRDPEYDELSDFAVNAAIYISLDEVLDGRDSLLASIDEFSNEEVAYDADVTENASLSLYEEGEFFVIVTATFNQPPPESLELPILIAGNGTMTPAEMLGN